MPHWKGSQKRQKWTNSGVNQKELGVTMGFPKRVDANQKALVKAFRDMGASVLILSAVGKGCPDILVGFRGRNALVEIKDGSKPPSARKLTEDEQKFHDSWLGYVCVINNAEEAIDLINRMGKC